MADHSWPRWLPGQELKASDLLGLEDYLLARSRILDEGAHGIESFDWENGMRVTEQNGARFLEIGKVSGVTPAGEPIVCEPSQLRALLQNVPEHDIWISVSAGEGTGEEREAHTDRGEKPSSTPSKMSLVLVAAPTRDVSPFEHPHRLYLGRYAFPQSQGSDPCAKLIKAEPFVRRLGGLEPWDKDWQGWVKPLRVGIENLGLEAFKKGLADTALGGELLRLQFEWPALPIPALLRRLRFIQWLANSPPDAFPASEHAKALIGDDVVEQLKALTGRKLPEYLAALLPRPEDLPQRVRQPPRGEAPPASAPPPPSGLTDALKLLLQALSVGGIDRHAPLEALEVWRDRVAAQRAIRSVGADLAAAIDLGALGPGADPWTRASVLISLAAIEGSAASALERTLLSPFVDIAGGTAARKAGTALEKLYAGEAAERRAGPIAFHVLATASVDTIGDLKGRTGALLASLRGGKPANAAPKDRVAAYLKEAKAAGRRWPAPQIPASGRLGRILLLGRPGSGRTTIKTTLSAAGAGVTPPEVQVLAQGEAIGSPTAGRTDVLVAVIEPALLSDPKAAQLVAALASTLRGALAASPNLRLAFVFSKADEYGVFTQDTSALHAAGKKVPDPRAKGRNAEAAWKALREGGSAGGEQQYSIAVVGTGGSSGSAEARPTRSWIVDQTRQLWELAFDRQSAFVTARLLTCRPLDRRFDPDGECSARQFLADLNAFVR